MGLYSNECKLKYKNIGVIHKENIVLSSAREAGISFITGHYSMFVDSDDCIENNTLEILNIVVML